MKPGIRIEWVESGDIEKLGPGTSSYKMLMAC